jgi:hypothetical protein
VRSTNHRVRAGLVGLVAVVALSIGMPAVAGAQQVNGSTGPTADQYDPPAVQVQTSAGGGGNDGGSGLTDPVGPLPFTGFDVIAMLAVALGVTGLGLALQRAVSRQAHGSD